MYNELAGARALLTNSEGKPTPQYQAYLQCEAEYNEATKQYNDAKSNAANNPMLFRNWPITGKQYSDAVTGALNKWIALGYKHEIDNALNMIKSNNNL